jgi:hypothetical protein
MGEYIYGGIEGIFGIFVHGYEATTKHQVILKKGGLHFPLSNYLNIMTHECFMELRRCIFITNPATYEHIPKNNPSYDNLWQIQWFVDEIQNACMREWSLGKSVTIDEMMVQYKGFYCPIWQYMPKNLEKWRIKL